MKWQINDAALVPKPGYWSVRLIRRVVAIREKDGAPIVRERYFWGFTSPEYPSDWHRCGHFKQGLFGYYFVPNGHPPGDWSPSDD